jgi:hypothetical protein
MGRWVVSCCVVGVFAVALVLDWLDGPGQHPDLALISALAAVAGMALGFKPPWSGKGE